MWECPVCKSKNETRICTGCGFDGSCDFLQYPTLAMVKPRPVFESPERISTRAANDANLQNMKRAEEMQTSQRNAELENSAAQYIMAQKYLDGDGVERDLSQAILWCEKAAQMNTEAKQMLPRLEKRQLWTGRFEKAAGVIRTILFWMMVISSVFSIIGIFAGPAPAWAGVLCTINSFAVAYWMRDEKVKGQKCFLMPGKLGEGIMELLGCIYLTVIGCVGVISITVVGIVGISVALFMIGLGLRLFLLDSFRNIAGYIAYRDK